MVLREVLLYRDVRRYERSVGPFVGRYGLRELVRSFLAGARVDAASLHSIPILRFPPSIRPLAWAATLAVAVLPRHKSPPVIHGSVRLGSNVEVKPLPKARNPPGHGPLEAKDIALSRRKPGVESSRGRRAGSNLRHARMPCRTPRRPTRGPRPGHAGGGTEPTERPWWRR